MRGRTVAIAGAIALVVLVAIVVTLLFSLDAIVERGIERYASAATGTAVEVEGVEIDLRGASARIRGLSVANPEGYTSARAFALRGIEIGLDPDSVGSERIVLTHVRVAEPIVTVELNAQGRTNLAELRQRIEARAGQPPDEPAAEGEPTKFAIRELVFEDGAIEASAADGSEGRAVLPSFTMQDLGGAGGAPAAGIARQILLELTRRAVVAAARGRVEEELRDRLEGIGGEAGEAARGLLEGLGR